MNEGAFMTKCEINRVEVFALVKQKGMSQVKAAQKLNLSIRHTQRLYKIYQSKGAIGLASQKRGSPSNRQLDKFLKARIIELIGMDLYQDFGPTYMTEILERNHQILVSRETIRKLMTSQGLWKSKKEKSPVVHQQRERRARCGELTQIDGSPHAWFEERGEKCTLIVFIDDATGRTYGKFFPTETTSAYLETTYEYIKKYGKPEAMYSDRHNDNNFRPIDSLKLLNGLSLDILLHFQEKDEILSNRDDLIYIEMLKDNLPEGKVTVIVGNDGGHMVPHFSLWQSYSQKIATLNQETTSKK